MASLDKYYTLNQTGFNYVYEYNEQQRKDIIKPVLFESYFVRNKDRQLYNLTTTNLTQRDYGIWSESENEIRDFVGNVTNFRLTYMLEHDIYTNHVIILD